MKCVNCCRPLPLSGKSASRPCAHIALEDGELCTSIADALRDEGWAVVESRTGCHLLQCIGGPSLGDQPCSSPDLVVVDAYSSGCSGLTIARKLRDLEVPITTVLIASSDGHRRYTADERDHFIYRAAPHAATQVTLDAARRCRHWDFGVDLGIGLLFDEDQIGAEVESDEIDELELARRNPWGSARCN